MTADKTRIGSTKSRDHVQEDDHLGHHPGMRRAAETIGEKRAEMTGEKNQETDYQ